SRSITRQLVAALEHCANLLAVLGKSQERTHLLDVVRAADANTWRNRFRDAWEQADGKTINDLLASAGAEKEISSAMLFLLSSFSSRNEKIAPSRAASLWRRFQQQ